MKHVTLKAVVDQELCIGCKLCEKVCPVYAISVVDKKATLQDDHKCRGCANCADRCPRYAIKMVERDDPFDVGVDVSQFDPEKIRDCVGTRAEEVAAALLSGATTPEEVSSMTGMRTGCTIECIQPMLRMVKAAGNELHPDPNGYQWYGTTVTAWDIPEAVKEKYSSRGFYFDEDRRLLDEIAEIRVNDSAKEDQ